MKKAKKYETFDQLKSSETKTADYHLALVKHSEFEKVMKEIMARNPKRQARKILSDSV